MLRGIEREPRSGSKRKISKVRTEIACYLSREMGISMAEMVRKLGVGTSAIAMAIRRRNPDGQKL
jgi:predicted HTH domain antitoxin